MYIYIYIYIYVYMDMFINMRQTTGHLENAGNQFFVIILSFFIIFV